MIYQARQCAPHDRFLNVQVTKIDSPRRQIKRGPDTSCVHLNCAQNPAPLEAPSNDLTAPREKILATLVVRQYYIDGYTMPEIVSNSSVINIHNPSI